MKGFGYCCPVCERASLAGLLSLLSRTPRVSRRGAWDCLGLTQVGQGSGEVGSHKCFGWSKTTRGITRVGEAGSISGHAGWGNQSRSLIWQSELPSSHASQLQTRASAALTLKNRAANPPQLRGLCFPGAGTKGGLLPPALLESGGSLSSRRPLLQDTPLCPRWHVRQGCQGRGTPLHFISLDL